MKIRHLLPLLALLAVAEITSAQTTIRFEGFADSPRNWRPSQPNLPFGFGNRDSFGTRGDAGGLFRPSSSFNYYADLFLNGSFNRATPLSASGEILIGQTSVNPPYAATTYVGHFSQSARPFVQVLGLAISGTGENPLTACAIIQFADGNAFVGKPFRVQANPDRILTWSYDWNPTGGAKGAGQLEVRVGSSRTTLTLSELSAGSDFSLDSFGLSQPPFQTPDSRSFLQLFVDSISYTANVGRAPSLRIRGPRTLRTTNETLTVRGNAKVGRGNQVVRVRYQLIRSGNPTRFRTANGTDQWKFETRVPRGASRIKVLARSDDGTSTTKTRRIRRR